MSFWERLANLVVTGTIFDEANNWIRNSEGSLVNLLSAIAPWAAPVAPAYLSLVHMTKRLDFPPFVAGSVAVVVEILGLTTISTAISFWQHNKRYQKSKEYKKAPVGLVLGAFVWYLLVIIAINVILLIFTDGQGAKVAQIISNGLLTTLSIPAALVLAVRTQHSELLKEMRGVQAGSRKVAGKTKIEAVSRQPVKGNAIIQALDQAWSAEQKVLTVTELVEQIKVAKSTAFTKRREWLSQHPEAVGVKA